MDNIAELNKMSNKKCALPHCNNMQEYGVMCLECHNHFQQINLECLVEEQQQNE